MFPETKGRGIGSGRDGRMEKQEMEVEWKRKMEMEIGNRNIKVAGLLAALIDLRVVAGLLFVCIRSSSSLQFT